jgi:hypothetical protein
LCRHDDKTNVLTGTDLPDSNGEYRDPAVGSHSLPDGHYKLFWTGSPSTQIKHKVFWVDCQPSAECTTWFFGSATVGTEFHEGDTWQGGTFTTIENDHYMLVRDEADGTTVGRFPMGFLASEGSDGLRPINPGNARDRGSCLGLSSCSGFPLSCAVRRSGGGRHLAARLAGHQPVANALGE